VISSIKWTSRPGLAELARDIASSALNISFSNCMLVREGQKEKCLDSIWSTISRVFEYDCEPKHATTVEELTLFWVLEVNLVAQKRKMWNWRLKIKNDYLTLSSKLSFEYSSYFESLLLWNIQQGCSRVDEQTQQHLWDNVQHTNKKREY